MARYPEKESAHCAKRRAAKKAALCGCCSPADFAKLYKRARLLGMHVDHIKPLAKGGKHCIKNLQLLTPVENMRKGAKWKEAA
jgi:5-methylcytosine-specific restriction endonuclease McrA